MHNTNWTPDQRRVARHEIPARMIRLEQELRDLGLFKTAVAINEATQCLGWEIGKVDTE